MGTQSVSAFVPATKLEEGNMYTELPSKLAVTWVINAPALQIQKLLLSTKEFTSLPTLSHVPTFVIL